MAITENHPSPFRPKEVMLGRVAISRFILGGNPFSGFAHRTSEDDREMLDWYTMDRVTETYRLAEAAGVTTHLGRADHFIIRALYEYRNEGGSMIWIAQTCPHLGGFDNGIDNALQGNAEACFLHGGVMDWRVAEGNTSDIPDAIRRIRDEGMAAGIAGHNPETIRWAADNLDLDFFMTCYYNPEDRRHNPARNYANEEIYLAESRDIMCALIQQLPAPAIHYKIMAAGRNDAREAFAYAAEAMRPGDAVCVGIFTKQNPDMIQEDVNLLETELAKRGK